MIPNYVTALNREIEYFHLNYGLRLPAHTIFFGGGTPSLISVRDYEKILGTLEKCFALQENVEITIEANPGTLSQEYLGDIRKLGVNRLSLGVQSALPHELHLLERSHDFFDVIRSLKWARKARFEQLNLDLIFGLPYQTILDWRKSLDLCIDLEPEHFSLYALSIEHDTPLSHWLNRGLVENPDQDIAAEMYEWAMERLDIGRWNQYEISNWARTGESGLMACQHNLQYWRNLPYLGLGAGAHGYAEGQRTVNVLSPAGYIQKLSQHPEIDTSKNFPFTPAIRSILQVDKDMEISETMMMGIRLVNEGVAESAFQARFGQSLEDRFSDQITRLCSYGLVEWKGVFGTRSLCLTKRGRLLGNQVFVEFI